MSSQPPVLPIALSSFSEDIIKKKILAGFLSLSSVFFSPYREKEKCNLNVGGKALQPVV